MKRYCRPCSMFAVEKNVKNLVSLDFVSAVHLFKIITFINFWYYFITLVIFTIPSIILLYLLFCCICYLLLLLIFRLSRNNVSHILRSWWICWTMKICWNTKSTLYKCQLFIEFMKVLSKSFYTKLDNSLSVVNNEKFQEKLINVKQWLIIKS